MFPPKRPNFHRISQSTTFSTKPPNQSRRISHWGRFRRNGRISAEFRSRGCFPRNGQINPAEFPLNFAPGDVSPETTELIPPNFALRDVSAETAEFPPNFAVKDVSDETAESIPPNFALGTVPTKRPN
ncbi:MAG: hypothetical protein Q8881_04305, partial [Sweet potato little leaf phytoplasma]|nr:hypothetical protein [Sweet potato little leaf phytoplasma]